MHEVAPRNFLVASVDHGLRPEGAAEAAFVRRICADRAIPHATLTLALDRGPGVQARARAARYATLGQWAAASGLGALLVAHHAEDQAETMLMRLNRGAGARGLAAMRSRTQVPGHAQLPLLRPLLGWRRADLAGVVAGAGLVAVDDPSNRDVRFERARLRAAMTSADWLDIDGLAKSANHLAEADEALDWAAVRAIATLREDAGALVWIPGDTPRVIALRVLEGVVARIGTSCPRGTEVSRWHDALALGRIATLGGVRGEARDGAWRFTPARPHRSA